MEEDKSDSKTNLPPHHVQQELCTTRPLYRQGKKLTAVKVYTINNESQHLLFYGVPTLKLSEELKASCFKFGELKTFELVKKYDLEEFTECYHAAFKRIQSARIAKRFLDNKSFYGGTLHVCYAPEYETLSETRDKIKQRQKDVTSRTMPGPTQLEYANYEPSASTSQDRKRKHPALAITDKRLKLEDSDKIWDGIPSELDPRLKDPLTNSSVGMKKHFQMAKTKPDGPIYGPISPEDNTYEPPVSKRKVHTTLLPTTVIKKNKEEYNKRIVFRNKNKSQDPEEQK